MGIRKRQFIPLLYTLHNTMTKLIKKLLITLAPVRPIDPSKPLHYGHNLDAYYHFHQRNGHDIEGCKFLKHLV